MMMELLPRIYKDPYCYREIVGLSVRDNTGNTETAIYVSLNLIVTCSKNKSKKE